MKEKTNQGDLSSYQLTAQEILGDSIQYTVNEDSSMVLCQRIRKSPGPPQIKEVSYCVIDMDSGGVIHKANLANGEVRWFSPVEIRIRNFKGYPTVNQKGVYIYNLETKSKSNQSMGSMEDL